MKNTMKITLWTDDDDEEIVEVPFKWEICCRCDGHGKHVNPNIDGHGISWEEWQNDWDEDSRDMYMSGGYDVPCEEGCENGKIKIPDLNAVSDDLRKRIEDKEAFDHAYEMQCAYERKMGY